ncbi:MAG: peptidoglycan-binding domain-containing protein [Pseudonocardiaceae bacterium]
MGINAGRYPFPGFVISQGATGVNVKLIQKQLNDVAAACLIVDGDFGPVTRQAVIDFQTSQQIDPDGLVAPPRGRSFSRSGASWGLRSALLFSSVPPTDLRGSSHPGCSGSNWWRNNNSDR